MNPYQERARLTLLNESAARASKGDVDAAEQLLIKGATAIKHVLDGQLPNEADKVALTYLADCLTQFRDGVPISKALGIYREAGRRKKSPTLRIVNGVLDDHPAVSAALRGQRDNAQAFNVSNAIKSAARKLGKKERQVRVGWEASGGMRQFEEDEKAGLASVTK